MVMGSSSLASSGANDPLNGLKFGKKIYFEDVGGGSGSSSSSKAPAPAKKVKGAVQPPPRCQVEGCNLDLTGAKAYYCRHKVCGMHSKAPKVVVSGLEQRFCQQCSRFHLLTEFDQGKRSCRRRLAGHNERRRKPPPGSFSSCYGRMPSLFHEDNGRFRSFVMDFTSPQLPGAARDVWPTLQAGNQTPNNHWQGSLVAPCSAVAVHKAHTYTQDHNSDEGLPAGQCVSSATCALSLLSNQPCSTTAFRNRASSISAANSDFNGATMDEPMPQPVLNTCMNHSSSFRGHGAGSSSHEFQHEMRFGHPGDVDYARFSGELELALQGNRQYPEFGPSREYDHPGPSVQWPL